MSHSSHNNQWPFRSDGPSSACGRPAAAAEVSSVVGLSAMNCICSSANFDIRLLFLTHPLFCLSDTLLFFILSFFLFSFFPFPTPSAIPQFLQVSSSNSQYTRRPFPYPLSPTVPLFLADLCTFCWPVCLIKRCIFSYVYSLPKTQHLICVATDEVLFHNNFLVFLILYLNFFSSLRIFARIIDFLRSFLIISVIYWMVELAMHPTWTPFALFKLHIWASEPLLPSHRWFLFNSGYGADGAVGSYLLIWDTVNRWVYCEKQRIKVIG